MHSAIHCCFFTILTGIAESIAKQVQRTNEELEARREAITKERARRPRKVRSRPASSTQQKPVPGADGSPPSPPEDLNIEELDDEIKQLRDDKDEELAKDSELGMEVANHTNNETALDIQEQKDPATIGTRATQAWSARTRKKSIQLPLRNSDFACIQNRKVPTYGSEASIAEDLEKVESSSGSSSKQS